MKCTPKAKLLIRDPHFEEKRHKRLALLEKIAAPIIKENQDLDHAIKVSIDLSLNKGSPNHLHEIDTEKSK
jgi:hypothetical protein